MFSPLFSPMFCQCWWEMCFLPWHPFLRWTLPTFLNPIASPALTSQCPKLWVLHLLLNMETVLHPLSTGVTPISGNQGTKFKPALPSFEVFICFRSCLHLRLSCLSFKRTEFFSICRTTSLKVTKVTITLILDVHSWWGIKISDWQWKVWRMEILSLLMIMLVMSTKRVNVIVYRVSPRCLYLYLYLYEEEGWV